MMSNLLMQFSMLRRAFVQFIYHIRLGHQKGNKAVPFIAFKYVANVCMYICIDISYPIPKSKVNILFGVCIGFSIRFFI